MVLEDIQRWIMFLARVNWIIFFFSSVAKLCPTLRSHGQQQDKPMSIESLMPSNHLMLCCPLLLLPSMFPIIRVFLNESALHIKWLNIGVSASTSVLPMNTQDWSLLGWSDRIFLQSKGLSRVLSNATVLKHQFLVLRFFYSPTLISIQDYWKNHSLD